MSWAKLWITSTVVLGVLSLVFVRGCVRANYEYERTVGSFWNLSVKASTLELKADYLNRFVAAVDSAHLSGNDAIFFPTPDNSIEQNLMALHSLQQRMSEIRGMDVTSFQYQQAISQITSQEQDEATAMLSVIQGRWFLDHHLIFWDWVGGIIGFSVIVGFVLSGVCLLAVVLEQ